MKLLNLTGHDVTVCGPNGENEVLVVLPPDGPPVRIKYEWSKIGNIFLREHSIPLMRRIPAATINLPEDDDALKIVSVKVFEALPDRNDLIMSDTGRTSIRINRKIVGIRQFIGRSYE